MDLLLVAVMPYLVVLVGADFGEVLLRALFQEQLVVQSLVDRWWRNFVDTR